MRHRRSAQPDFIDDADLKAKSAAIRQWVRAKLLPNPNKAPSETGNLMQHEVYVQATGQLFFDASHNSRDDPSGGRGKRSMKAGTIPIATQRFHPVLEWLQLDASGEKKPGETLVFSEALAYLRHEYASRLVERGVPLAQVRDLLGHASITTTERYDNQTFAALQAAAQRLESGKTFTILHNRSEGRSRSEKSAVQEAS